MLQDAGAQQDVPDRRRLGVEDLLHQVAGQGAVLGDQLGDELAGVGMGAHGDRGQAQAGRPALGPPGQALQRVRRQRDAVPGQEHAGFGGGESQVAGPDLGQLPGQPVAVQRQRVHPSRTPPGAGPARYSAAGSQARPAPRGRSAGAGRPGPASPAGPGRPAPPPAASTKTCAAGPPPRGGQRLREGNTGPAQCRDDIGPEDPGPVVDLIQPGPRPPARVRPPPTAPAPSSCPRPRPAVITVSGHHRVPRPISSVIRGRGYRPVGHVRRGDLRGQDRNAGRNRRCPDPDRVPGSQAHRDLPLVPPAGGYPGTLAIADHALGSGRPVRPGRPPSPHHYERPAGQAPASCCWHETPTPGRWIRSTLARIDVRRCRDAQVSGRPTQP